MGTKKGMLSILALILIVGFLSMIFLKYHYIPNNQIVQNIKELNRIKNFTYEEMSEYCKYMLEEERKCPSNYCRSDCIGFSDGWVCSEQYNPNYCASYSADNCPSFCSVFENCKGGLSCDCVGDDCRIGYSSITEDKKSRTKPVNEDCRKGWIKRCDYPLSNCSDYMVNRTYYPYNHPRCIPCGDGICKREIETYCNCPEDCSKP